MRLVRHVFTLRWLDDFLNFVASVTYISVQLCLGWIHISSENIEMLRIERSQVLRMFPLLDEVSEDDLISIFARMECRNVERDQTIMQRLDQESDVFYILDGSFRATSFSENGRETIYRDMTVGEFFGEFAAIDDGPRTATIVSLTPGKLLYQSQNNFLEMVEQHPSVAMKLLKQVTKRVRYLANRVYELSTQRVEERLYAEMLRMSGYYAGEPKSVIEPFPRHVDIAGSIGAQREAVTRILSSLVEQGVIQKIGKKMQILDQNFIISGAKADVIPV